MIKNRKAKFELSAGGIVFNTKNGKILTIVDSSGRIGLPKGQNEKGEPLKTTAEREIKEETGVKKLNFIEKLGEVKFFYKFKDNLIFKKIIYFFFTTQDEKLKPQKKEIKNALWLSEKEVIRKNQFKNLNPILKKASKIIEKLKNKND